MGYKRAPARKRFWRHVKKTESCWTWTAYKNRRAYGEFRVGSMTDGTRRMKLAHRYSWELYNGTIPESLFVLHKCDNPPCVNPEHLFLGTHTDNMRDMIRKGRRAVSPSMRGESNPNSKLSAEDVFQIRHSLMFGVKGTVLSSRYGVSNAHISAIKKHKTWKYRGGEHGKR
jgi:hypothetical protein